jgi:hypothetical protein
VHEILQEQLLEQVEALDRDRKRVRHPDDRPAAITRPAAAVRDDQARSIMDGAHPRVAAAFDDGMDPCDADGVDLTKGSQGDSVVR